MARKKAAKPEPAIRNRIKRHVTIRAGDLVPHEQNFRRHPDEQRAALQGLYDEIGFARSLLAYELPDGRLKLVDGHLRQEMTPDMEVTVEVLDLNDEEAKLMLASVDPLAALATADAEKLKALLDSFQTDNEALNAMLAGLAADSGILASQEGGGGMDPSEAAKTLADRFLVPPFSVLDARQGYWQDRKRAWLSLGIQSEIGRGGASTITAMPPQSSDKAEQSGTLADIQRERDGKDGDAQRPDAAQGRVCPGGSARPAMKLGKDGRTVRGDGKGRPLNAAGQD